MYNRYTPRQDGGYRHDRVPEAPRQNQADPQPQYRSDPPQACAPGVSAHLESGQRCHASSSFQPGSATGFLSSLLLRNMDTGDLLMLLILLLLITDGSDDAPNPLLTIALFFLME